MDEVHSKPLALVQGSWRATHLFYRILHLSIRQQIGWTYMWECVYWTTPSQPTTNFFVFLLCWFRRLRAGLPMALYLILFPKRLRALSCQPSCATILLFPAHWAWLAADLIPQPQIPHMEEPLISPVTLPRLCCSPFLSSCRIWIKFPLREWTWHHPLLCSPQRPYTIDFQQPS